jgi:hypothetical protein
MGFGVQKNMERFFVIQTFQYLNFLIPVSLLIYQKVRLGFIKMDLYPIILYAVMICYRIFIVSIRHATTPPRVYRDLFIIPISKELLDEGLAFSSWAEISEENITRELTRALLKNDVYQEYFKFKVFLPVWP